MKLMHKLFAIFAFTCASCSAATLNPQAVKRDLEQMPVRKVIENLQSKMQYDHLLDLIAEGKTQWIELAPKLYEGTDAGGSEDIEIVLATTLPKNAPAVLAALDASQRSKVAKIDISVVCSAPFIEPTDDFYNNYLKVAASALKAVKDEKLKPMAQKCLAYLK